MVAATYGAARVAAPADVKAKPGKPRKGFFARFLESIEQSQMKRAARDLARYRHLLPFDHELRGDKLPGKNELPFGGW
jgi:hypothetical protein